MARNDQQLPTIYEGEGVHIFKNQSGEIFIENIKSGAQMRMSASGDDLNFTTFGGGKIEPMVVANSIGWRVTKR